MTEATNVLAEGKMLNTEPLMNVSAKIAHVCLALSDNVQIFQLYVNGQGPSAAHLQELIRRIRVNLIITFRELSKTASACVAAADNVTFDAHKALTQKPFRPRGENSSINRYFSRALNLARSSRQKLEKFDEEWDSSAPKITSYGSSILTTIWSFFGGFFYTPYDKQSTGPSGSDLLTSATRVKESSQALRALIVEIEDFWGTLSTSQTPSSMTERELYTIKDEWKILQDEWADRENNFALLMMALQKLHPLTIVEIETS